MENEVTVEPLPATTEQSDAGMEGNVSQSQYAAQLVEQAMAKAAAGKTSGQGGETGGHNRGGRRGGAIH